MHFLIFHIACSIVLLLSFINWREKQGPFWLRQKKKPCHYHCTISLYFAFLYICNLKHVIHVNCGWFFLKVLGFLQLHSLVRFFVWSILLFLTTKISSRTMDAQWGLFFCWNPEFWGLGRQIEVWILKLWDFKGLKSCHIRVCICLQVANADCGQRSRRINEAF